ncbi:DUF5060 domain-containing protein [Paenibacillus sepulcri]
MKVTKEVERWGVFELSLAGPDDGNPFVDIQFGARFRIGTQEFEADGFYDGDGVYRVRFMPETEGVWTYTTVSGCRYLDKIVGEFHCTPPSAGNHGPVRVKDETLFGYADGTRYFPLGTTCYVWHLQDGELREKTLQTLKSSPFNKLRMCLFPKSYLFNPDEPKHYPFDGSPRDGFDLAKFNPAYFGELERHVLALSELGIQADLILLHPYDKGRWGFDRMNAEQDERYLRYTLARLAAYRNVWWSLANEYDLMTEKKPEDWDRYFRIVQECDYGNHLRSIHNCRERYDYGKPWVTHASIQTNDVKAVSGCTRNYGKPVVIDECGYEGNIHTRWGSLTPEEMVCRIWEGTFRGGYVTHGETYVHPDDILWWSHGGELHGASVPRIAFLARLLAEAPDSIKYCTARYDASTLEIAGDFYFQYFGPHRFAFREFAFPEGTYKADLIDTWNMTVTPLEGRFEGRSRIELPSELYYALRIQRVNEDSNAITGE